MGDRWPRLGTHLVRPGPLLSWPALLCPCPGCGVIHRGPQGLPGEVRVSRARWPRAWGLPWEAESKRVWVAGWSCGLSSGWPTCTDPLNGLCHPGLPGEEPSRLGGVRVPPDQPLHRLSWRKTQNRGFPQHVGRTGWGWGHTGGEELRLAGPLGWAWWGSDAEVCLPPGDSCARGELCAVYVL